MNGLQGWLRELAERASPRTALLFAVVLVLAVVWLVSVFLQGSAG
jgi:uncharacterized membrane protein